MKEKAILGLVLGFLFLAFGGGVTIISVPLIVFGVWGLYGEHRSEQKKNQSKKKPNEATIKENRRIEAKQNRLRAEKIAKLGSAQEQSKLHNEKNTGNSEVLNKFVITNGISTTLLITLENKDISRDTFAELLSTRDVLLVSDTNGTNQLTARAKENLQSNKTTQTPIVVFAKYDRGFQRAIGDDEYWNQMYLWLFRRDGTEKKIFLPDFDISSDDTIVKIAVRNDTDEFFNDEEIRSKEAISVFGTDNHKLNESEYYLDIIKNIDEFFRDKTNIIKVVYSKKYPSCLGYFSRALHEMSKKEIYAIKIVLNMVKDGDIGLAEFEEIISPIVLNSGKCEAVILPKDRFKSMDVEVWVKIAPAAERKAIEIINFLQDMDADKRSKYERLAFERNSSGEFQKAKIGEIFERENSNNQLLLGADDDGKIFLNSEKSLITLAPPGSGKTQCHVLPTLSQYKGAAIVLDIKGECFVTTGRWRRENVGPVFAFTPAHPDKSAKYNPLSFISQDPDQVWEDARLLAEMLIVPQSKNDPTWETQGRQFLTLLIAYVAYEPDEKRNMTTILDFVSEMGLEEVFENILEEGAPFPSSMRRTANKFKKMRETSEKQFQGVLSGASQHLTVWEGSAVEKITASSDWSPEDFRASPPPTLYLCIPPNAIDTYAPLLRIIIGQHVRQLMKEEPDREALPILFMLDEMPRLGDMAPIREALEVGRSYGIKLWMFAQYVGQIRGAYGREIADGMIESCGARIYMNTGADTAEKLAKTLGTRENLLTGKTEPVVTPQELMGPEWRDDMLVFATGEPPLRLKKVFYHEQAVLDTPN